MSAKTYQTFEGEIKIKEWVHSEAEKQGTTPAAIYARMSRGAYRDRIQVRKVNYQVGFVKEIQPT